jgi:hypothetical protein
MFTLMETSLTSMKSAFPTAPELIQGIPTLASLIDLMLHMCRCAQTHKTPASPKINMLFCAAALDSYSFFTTEAYPTNFFQFPKEVNAVPDFSACNTDNEHETLKSTHALARKTRTDIITMNAALSNIFLENLPKSILETYKPIRMKQPNNVFLHMFDWFIAKYGKMMTKDCKENCKRITADWHPADGFEPLMTRLFLGESYLSAACYPMVDCNVINIGLRVIKHCGMYSKEYKGWIARESESPPIVETLESFKDYWAKAISLINQMAIPTMQHKYGMAVMDDDATIALYGELLANFGAAFAAPQEAIKGQATSLAPIQGKLANLQQYCMAVSQQPPSSIYAPTQQQRLFSSGRSRCNNNGGNRGGRGFFIPQQSTNHGFGGGVPGGGGGIRALSRPPMPYKQWENWHYCHTHGGDVDNTHTSAMCGKPGPMHNPNATRANMMGGSIAGMHKTILPSAAGQTHPNLCPPQQQQLQLRQPSIPYYPTQPMNLG